MLQWNLNGYYAHLEKLQILNSQRNPKIICLQETNYKDDHCHNPKNFEAYFKNRTVGSRASGGVATFISNELTSKEIPLNTDLEAVAVEVHLRKKIHVCNVYIPNSRPLILQEIQQLIDQIPTPRIIVGDFNSHNLVWGSNNTDRRGRIMEQIIDLNSLVLLNSGAGTHFNAFSGTYSAIDLTLCDATISHMFTWEVDKYLHGSDHFPIHLKSEFISSAQSSNTHNLRWNLKAAHWPTYTDYIKHNLDALSPGEEVDVMVQSTKSLILQAAKLTVPKFAKPKNYSPVPWWSEQCREAIKLSKQAFNKYKRNSNLENLTKFKELRAKARFV